MKRIVYAGSLRPGDNGPDRCAVFESRGYRILPADRLFYQRSGTRVERSVSARFNFGRAVVAYNRYLQRISRQEDYDSVFVDKGVWVWPETLQALKAGARQHLAVHFTPDAQFLENTSRAFRRCVPTYDVCVTTKPFELERYAQAGARETLLIEQGYGRRLRPVEPGEVPEHLRSEVCFVGYCQTAYAERLSSLAHHVPVKIWGPKWPSYAKRHPWAKPCVQGQGVFGSDYAGALSGAKIAIGLLSKRIPETTTTRTFEIPACGTMLLAERTEDHQRLFEEDREAVFFSSTEELCDKASYYLEHAAEREAIAAAGRRRCLDSGYGLDHQLGRVVDWLEARLA